MSDFPWDYWRHFPVNPLGEMTTPAESALDEPPPIVTVFGAGITGLSVAHELIERGFAVQVVEKTESQTEEYECQVGGMAANQLSRVPASLQELHETLFESDPQGDLPRLRFMRARRMQPTQPRYPIKQRIRFEKPDSPGDWRDLLDGHEVKNAAKLNDVLTIAKQAYEAYETEYELARAAASALAGQLWSDPSAAVRQREILLIEIRGYTDMDGTAEANRALSQTWAEEVRLELIALNAASPDPIPNFGQHLVATGLGDTAPIGDQRTTLGRARSNRVEFRIVEQVMPGEHGFRFFPSFYRHLFDTMRRTPILDLRGNETGETAYDQLVATPDANIALDDKAAPHELDTRRIRSLKDVQNLLDVLLRNLRFTDRDILCLQLCMFRYMSSCRQRRELEAEGVNFWNYVGGDAAGYSPAAREFIEQAPKALAAMSGTETDARTQCSLLLQLLFKGPFDPQIDDMTLNNSSSAAWLGVWKSYLRQKGVRFFVGKLDALTLVDGEFLPEISGPGDWTHPRPEEPRDGFIAPARNDFFVLALPFEAVSALIWDAHAKLPQGPTLPLPQFDGPFGQLMRFDIDARRRNQQTGGPIPRERDAATGKPSEQRDPLRDISGIQYFFTNNYRFGHGHVYFFESEWGLTSISQLAYWRDRTDPIGNYIGQNSVDIGDWYTPDGQSAKSTWRSTVEEIADATWRQIKAGLAEKRSGMIIDPQYYHLDRGIEFVEQNFVGFFGSVLVSVVGTPAASALRISLVKDGSETEIIDYVVAATATRAGVAADIRASINALRGGTFAFAVQHDTNNLLVSPLTTNSDGRAVIAIRGDSVHSFFVSFGGGVPLEFSGMRETVLTQIESAIIADPNLPFQVTRLGASFNLLLEGAGPITIGVANADDMIEVIDGSQLEVSVENRNVQVVRQPQRSSSRLVRVMAVKEAWIETPQPDPGRRYSVKFLRAGDPTDQLISESYIAQASDGTADDLRNELRLRLEAAAATVGGFSVHELPDPALPNAQFTGVRIVMDPSPTGAVAFELTTKDLPVSALMASSPLQNRTQFLINVPAQWQCRPGLSRTKLPQESLTTAKGETEEFRYWHDTPALSRWVPAGTFMATHTRMTTMEAANESARHAVNAILQKICAMPKDPGKPYGYKGRLIADPCEIWDPEEHELDDLCYFKELDQALLDADLPHLVEILKLENLVLSLPQTEDARLELWDEIYEFMTEAQVDLIGQLAAGSQTLDQAYSNLAAQLQAAFAPKQQAPFGGGGGP